MLENLFLLNHHIIIQTGSRYCHGADGISHSAQERRVGSLLPDSYVVHHRDRGVALPNMNPHYNRMFQLFVDNENENILP